MTSIDPPSINRHQDSRFPRERQMAWQNRELTFSHTSGEFPATIQKPKYAIGDRCRWIPTSATDWGTIIGQVIAPAESVQSTASQWVWLYLVLLDLDSPSHQWVTTDWAEEGDLERFHPPARSLFERSINE